MFRNVLVGCDCSYAGVVSYLNETGKLLPQFTAEGAVKKLVLYSDKSSVATLTNKMMLSLHTVHHDGTLSEALKLCSQLINQTVCLYELQKQLLNSYFTLNFNYVSLLFFLLEYYHNTYCLSLSQQTLKSAIS